MKDRLTNRKFAKEDEKFLQACIDANVESTVRQASKYRNKKGRAYLMPRAPKVVAALQAK